MSDLITLAEYKAAMGISDSSGDTVLSLLITQVSAAIQSWLNRDLSSVVRSESRDGNGKDAMVLAEYPVTAVSSVVINGNIIPAAANAQSPGYEFSDTAIYLRGYVFDRGRRNVQLVYTAGYAMIPDDIKRACIETVTLEHRRRDHIDVSSKALAGETVSYIVADMPPSAKTRLQQHKRVILL